MPAPEYFSFVVYPTALDERFETFAMDVPTMQGEEFAARRAWWQAFHLLGARGFEPEEFSVAELVDGRPGRVVGSGGLTNLVHAASPERAA